VTQLTLKSYVTVFADTKHAHATIKKRGNMIYLSLPETEESFKVKFGERNHILMKRSTGVLATC
jgi:hypothetical protein